MGGGLESRCVGRVCGAVGAVRLAYYIILYYMCNALILSCYDFRSVSLICLEMKTTPL